MKGLLQDLHSGAPDVAELPAPAALPGHVVVRTSRSLISAGTERMLAEFGKAGWLERARQQPDKLRQVLDKVRSDGIVAAYEAVRARMEQPLVPGYCNVGTVIEVGVGVEEFRVGDRVASNGHHAEAVCVPKHLCARIPEGVTDEQAAFTVLSAVGLQGIRLANPTLGECFVVTGLGLVGLLTVQMLRAHGCRVLGLDPVPSRLELARRFGAETVDLPQGEDPVAAAKAFSRGRGVDAVLIAAATDSSAPMHQAARMCRKRGRIVLVGATGLELSRADFYEKELSFQVSCSYGPGRHDPAYEAGGQDYPIGYVRWTEQRNFEAVLDLMATGTLDPAALVSHRFPLERAPEAYRLLTSGAPSLGILFEYPGGGASAMARSIALPSAPRKGAKPAVGFIGAGAHAGRVLIPAFARAGAALRSIVSAGGVTAAHHGRRFGFARAGTDVTEVLGDSEADTVVIATRHDSHARYVVEALGAGKHVFVEKPLCLTLDELERVRAAMKARPDLAVMAGFNRRFAPHVVRIRALLDVVKEPKSLVITVNAGAVPPGHWISDPEAGGGRIVGEACHFIDLLRHLAGHPVTQTSAVPDRSGQSAAITLRFADGSVGTVHYLASGNRAVEKERLEVYCAGRILRLENFRRMRGFGWPGFSRMNLWRQDKGQAACVRAFVEALRSGAPPPIPREELLEVARVSIEAQTTVGSR